jgi:hypothetical protein
MSKNHSKEWREKVSHARTGKHYILASLAKIGNKNPAWKGNKAKKISGNKRAQRIFREKMPCEICGKLKTDKGRQMIRHHINGNTLDNRKENIKWLCRACHKKYEHPDTGKSTRFKETVPKRNCKGCGILFKDKKHPRSIYHSRECYNINR